MESGKPVRLGRMRPLQLSDQKDLEAFIVDHFPRIILGFALLETRARWGECTVDFAGTDETGALVAIFPTVSGEERDFLDLVARAIHAMSWFEENKRVLKEVYNQVVINWDLPLWVILVVQGLNGRSRSISQWLERSGIEVVEYQCCEFDVWVDERHQVCHGISLEAKGEEWGSWDARMPKVARVPAVAAAVQSPESAPPPTVAAAIQSPESVQTPTVAEATRAQSALREVLEPEKLEARWDPPPEELSIERFIASLADEKLQQMCAQISAFFRSLVPGAVGVVNPNGRSFTLTAEGEHVASVYLDKGFLWIEAGPEQLPTGKIAGVRVLERVLKRLEPLLFNRMGRGRIKTYAHE